MIRCDIYIVSHKEKKIISHDYNYKQLKLNREQKEKLNKKRRGYYGYYN